MPPSTIQVPSIILPQVWTLGIETEVINDLVTHPSIDIPVEFLQEKIIHVFATEVAGLRATGVIVGGPFAAGEVVVGAPSGAAGILLAQGANWVEIVYIVGTFAATDTIVGATSGAAINGALIITAAALAIPGNLWLWVELSPVASTTSTSYWSAIGGGGGPLDPATGLPYIAPVAPAIEVATGVNGTVHTLILPWAIHSPYARLVVQTPVAAALPAAFWVVQALISAKGS